MRLERGIGGVFKKLAMSRRRACLIVLSASGVLFYTKGSLYKGENQHRQHFGQINYQSLHAEINALLKIYRNKNIFAINSKAKVKINATVYVARPLYATGCKEFGCARPCEHCSYHLYNSGIKKIKYTDFITTSDGDKITVLCTLKRKNL